jgi:6,7-dimethyl-8-ribityllumazine synthase
MVKSQIIVSIFVVLVVAGTSYHFQQVSAQVSNSTSVQNLNGTLSISIGNITPTQLKALDDNRTLLAGIVGSAVADAIHAKATASPSGTLAPQWKHCFLGHVCLSIVISTE